MNNKNVKNIIIGIGIILCTGAQVASAAAITLHVPKTPPKIGEAFAVSLMLDPQGAQVNAFSVNLEIPKGYMIKQVNDQDSIVTLWIKKPSTIVNTPQYEISGVITGGFSGMINPFSPKRVKPGKVLDFVMVHAGEGEMHFGITDATAYQNDGQGTELPIMVAVIADGEAGVSPRRSRDLELPELFTPTLVYDDLINEGRPLVVFNTTDKGSGIDYYAVKQNKGEWIVTESPYEFSTKKITPPLWVKAVDHSGNERIVVVPIPRDDSSNNNWFATLLVVVVITIAVLLVLGVRKLRKV